LFRPYDVPAYARFDAFLGYRLSRGVQLSLNVENLFDKEYISSGDSDAVYPGAPFSLFGKVELRW
jgi:outer membrane receptor protein involved in Fe transport